MKKYNFTKIAIIIMSTYLSSNSQNFVEYTKFGDQGSSNNQFNRPTGIFVANNNMIYVADNENDRILVLTQSGSTIGFYAKFGSLGTSNNQLSKPNDVTVSNSGKIYIADTENHRIQVLTQSGTTLGFYATFGQRFGTPEITLGFPKGVFVDSDDKIFIADHARHRIQVLTQSGTTLGFYTTFGTNGTADNQFDYLKGITKSNDGKIYVADSRNHRIQVLTISGTTIGFYTSFGTLGSENNELNYPEKVAVGSDGTIYVSDKFNRRVQVLTQTGRNLGYKNSILSFDAPTGLHIGANNVLAVADQNNSNISIWNPCNTLTSIITQPISQTICGSNMANLTVSATGIDLKYEWFQDWLKLNITTSGFNATGTATYRVEINGKCNNVVSNNVIITKFANCLNTNTTTGNNTVTGINTSLEENKVNFTISPNPNNGSFIVQSAVFPLEYSITNIFGVVIKAGVLNTKETQMELSLAKGLYFFRAGGKSVKMMLE